MDQLESICGVSLDMAVFKDWSQLEKHYSKLNQILSYQLFTFSRSNIGAVGCQQGPSETVVWTTLRKSTLVLDIDTPPMVAKGLSNLKRNDLYYKVARYVPLQYRDIICPKPSEDIVLDVKNARAEKRAKQRSK